MKIATVISNYHPHQFYDVNEHFHKLAHANSHQVLGKLPISTLAVQQPSRINKNVKEILSIHLGWC